MDFFPGLKSVCYGGILSRLVNIIDVVLNFIVTVDCTICTEQDILGLLWGKTARNLRKSCKEGIQLPGQTDMLNPRIYKSQWQNL